MDGDTDFQARAAREGDAEAFTRLYERLAPALHAWARFRLHGALRRQHDPEDLLQEVWWRALESFPSFDPQKGAFRGWLFGIATRVYLQFMQRAATRSRTRPAVKKDETLPPEIEAQLTSITTAAGRRDSVAVLVEKIGQLRREDQRLFVHRGLEGLTAKEAAPLLGLTPDAVKKAWQRLREKLEPLTVWSEFVDPEA